MVQGDEPMVNEEMINESSGPLLDDKSILVSNLYSEIKSKEELEDSNCIKVVHDNNYNALYFSRSPIPFQKGNLLNKPKNKYVLSHFKEIF